MTTISKAEILKVLEIRDVNSGVSVGPEPLSAQGDELVSLSPIDGEPIAAVRQATRADYERVAEAAEGAFRAWRVTPAPQRGEIVREIGEELRKVKDALGALVTLEMGKILPEGKGEVQEMIDICDFATGQSRMLYGKTMPSERPGHRLYEQWHPRGPAAVITAFNFPVAVWAWNAALAGICGDPVIWKPSPHAPLTAVATTNVVNRVLARHNLAGLFNLVVGDIAEIGDALLDDRRIALYSFTGSTAVGKKVAARLAPRFVKTIFECGGNNAIVVDKDADLELVVRAATFAAVGTAGQRCTSLRRLFVHRDVKDEVTSRLRGIYERVVPKIGNPLAAGTVMGPMVHGDAVVNLYVGGIRRIESEGGRVLFGNRVLDGDGYKSGCYVVPTLVESDQRRMPVVQEEIFAPVLHVMEWGELDEAIELHNAVPQGLSSAVFSNNLRVAEAFLSAAGSDCGIANVNIGTSGAEIGGAFGGEKDTGGGRESGSDAWKQYMRRQTVTINYSTDLPLAQGIDFTV